MMDIEISKDDILKSVIIHLKYQNNDDLHTPIKSKGS